MKTRLIVFVGVSLVLTGISLAATQPAADDERRAAITVLRAINTAENAVKQRGGKYVALAELVEHPAMGRVKPNITMAGPTVTHQGATIRLTLNADGTQYQVAVVPAATCGTAAFSDERGLIYTGKVLDC
jgi:Tfp pilus assembly protein PilX